MDEDDRLKIPAMALIMGKLKFKPTPALNGVIRLGAAMKIAQLFPLKMGMPNTGSGGPIVKCSSAAGCSPMKGLTTQNYNKDFPAIPQIKLSRESSFTSHSQLKSILILLIELEYFPPQTH